MTSSELRRVAKALYELPPAEFTSARNQAAREASQRSDAAAIKRLPRAQATAWAVSTLVREDPTIFDELLDLGERLRDAQENSDPVALRSLGAERQKLLSRASARTRELADGAGVTLSGSAMIEVTQTLQAAMTDPDAAALVRDGLLVRGLAVTGWEPVRLEGAAALPPEGVSMGRRARAARPRASRADPEVSERERKAAEAAAWSALDDVATAHQSVNDLAGALGDLASRRAELEAERTEIEEQLRGVESDLAHVYHDIQVGERDRKAAERAEVQAKKRAKQAQERLDRLG
ncbi:hypothetical protein ITJ38_01210 [Agreia pratensis]|uniref:Uncharacterized protein n=1 Tax=Agreia pratensis TaxID=150121 RepID=A0A1X7INH4_9MICO|nr:hypothetical protein [Agreia pratensis]MBF4633016.1 hypothetical protein [Agreia pratensis]SMG16221.1 hypothetical protein SAMN06296010_0682 [Agreia pratensis]